jgi:fructose-1,6-bisphosphatase I / sedoheptulose-1,7-bisphosphatase
MSTASMTLFQHVSQQMLAQSNDARLAQLLDAIATATMDIAALVAKGPTAEVTAKLTSQNVQGETQMQLDVFSNAIFIEALRATQLVAGLVSEEIDEAMALCTDSNHAPFLVYFDPLDGSSNIAVNGCIGSIFSVVNPPNTRPIETAHYLQQGNAQVAAGYALYGPKCMLVLTIGQGTHGYTLDSNTNTYRLTHPDMRIPKTAVEFSINASNERFWEPPMQRYIAECKAGIDGVRLQNFNMRWVASMVADVHRILMRGGVYLYPKDNKLPLKAGHLRLLYEANPMALLVEQAHGASSNGRQRLLDITPTDIHQRIPVVLGSRAEVSLIEQYHQAFDDGK